MFRSILRSGKKFFSEERFSKKIYGQKTQPDYSPSLNARGELAKIQPRFKFQPDSYIEWRDSARNELKRLLGEFPTRLAPVRDEIMVWEAEDKNATYEKVILQVGDSIRIPIYRGSPKSGRIDKTLICLQGHTSGMHLSLRMDSSESFVEHGNPNKALGSYAISQGFNIVCIEQDSLGERAEKVLKKKAAHPCFDASMHQLLLGKTILGARVAEALTILSYEKSREQYSQIGLMGNSLGGTVSLFASAISDEPDFAVASCCISDFEHSLFAIYHCADLYVPGLAVSFRMGDIVGLCAPKPLVICAGVADPIFPLRGFAIAREAAQAVYAEAGAGDQLRTIVGAGGHRLYLPEVFAELSRLGK
ncbi:MAG: hypothetical protein P8M34_10635 [Saprospiraceae bacterium]|nr:hypothetical protein [Saprospiraceae bacterium]